MKVKLFFAGMCIFMAATMALAQTETGQITGLVRDPSGAIVPNATVTVRSLDRQFSRSVTSSSIGAYTVTNLAPGRYEVRVEASGFGPFTREVQVTVGSRNTIDASLGVSGSQTTVEVVAAPGVEVNTQDQQISQVVTRTQVTQLPTITRNPYDLVQLSGNVNQDPADVNASARGAGVNINGQRSASTNILLDGAENRDEFTATVGTNVPLDSVQEFRVISSDFTAEYGRASGGVVNVATRSGTNEFHGSAYEFNRISNLAANSYQNKATGQPRDRFVRNQFGYSFGGPIIHDRAYFFQSTEWIRVRSRLNTQALVPTPAFLATTSPATQNYFSSLGQLRTDLTPAGTVTAGDLIASGNLAGPVAGLAPTTPVFQVVNFPTASDAGGGAPQDTYFAVGRVDLNLTNHTTLYGRYAADHENWFNGNISTSPYTGYETGQNVLNQNAMINLNHVFSPSIVSQSKVAYNRLNLVQPLGTAGTVPGLFPQANTPLTLTVASGGSLPLMLPGYIPIFPGSALPFGGPQNLYQFYQDLSWTHGSHSFRFGGQYVHTRDNRAFGAFETGFETLGRTGNLDQMLGNLISGQLFQFQGAVNPQGKFPCTASAAGLVVTPDCTVTLPVGQPSFSRNNRFNDAAAYLQDTWKMFPRFTLNLGIRWEYYGPQHNVDPSLDSNFYLGSGTTLQQQVASGSVQIASNSPVGGLWAPDYNNFAPRVGFAWDLFGGGTTSLRGGYGMAYERNFGNVTFNVIQNPPNYAVIALTAGADVPAGSLPITTSNAGPLGGGTGAVPLPPSSLRVVDPHIPTAYAHFWSLALEHQLAPNTILGLEYSGSRGIHQYSISNYNEIGTGNLFLGEPVDSTGSFFPRLNPQYTGINWRGANGDSYYHGLNVRLQSNNFHNTGLNLTANYTWSHAIDDLSTTFSETNNAFNLGYLDPFNPSLDRGNADFDVRHRLVLGAVWETPWLKNSRGFLGQTLGGWTLAPIFTANTGYPFSVYDCTFGFNACPRYAPETGAANSLPQAGLSNPPASGANVFDYLTLPASQPFTAAGLLGELGGFSEFGPYPANMTARNQFRGPGHWNLDMGVYKNFKLTERFGMQLRGELFNAFNHPNLFVVGTSADVSSSSMAPGTGACAATAAGPCPVVEAKRGGLGINSTSDTRERRNVQLAIKLTF